MTIKKKSNLPQFTYLFGRGPQKYKLSIITDRINC